MLTRIIFAVLVLSYSASVLSFDLDVRSVRLTLSKPDTSHSLIYNDPNDANQKTVFNLTPINNERVGVFVNLNGIEIGYALDVFESEIETKTQNFLVSYKELKNSKITLNYQILEGLQTDAENLAGLGVERRFFEDSKSTKVELFGIHNLYTFGETESLFDNFFLNEPRLSNRFDWSLSLVGAWSLKHVALENTESIIFQTEFLTQDIEQVGRLESNSANISVGPFLSVNLPHNFNFFAEYRVGAGFINNTSNNGELKESGEEKQDAIGVGLSWTSSDEKTLILVRGWEQNGRHINTSFGDLSIVRFF